MGFFNVTGGDARKSHSDELLHAMGCRACPLNRITGNKTPHMEASGAESPKVYILGEYPGTDEDEEGAHFDRSVILTGERFVYLAATAAGPAPKKS